MLNNLHFNMLGSLPTDLHQSYNLPLTSRVSGTVNKVLSAVVYVHNDDVQVVEVCILSLLDTYL